MTKNYYLELPLIKYWFKLNGCFPVKPIGKNAGGLDAARQYLREGRTVIIFPEGKIVRPNSDTRIHSGVQVLAKEFSVDIIPISILLKNQQSIPGAKIVMGKPFDGSKMTAEEIMQKVYDL